MFPKQRRKQIVEILKKEGSVKSDELAALFEVSVDSIRGDLRALDHEGVCNRVYGGATYIQPKEEAHVETFDINNVSEEDMGRLRVAKRAYMEINNGDSIFLDISRTNLLLADILANGDKQVIVTTNMIEILPRLSKNPKITALGTGGYLNMELNGLIGTATISMLEPLLFAKAFIGAHGIDMTTQGVAAIEPDDGLVKQQVIQNASYKFLLADSKKFKSPGNFRFATLTDFSAIISDTTDPEVIKKVAELGIPLLR